MSILSYVGLSFGSGEAAVCDFPLESNVLDGVIYADGAMTGSYVDSGTPPPTPAQVSGTANTYDENGVAESGVVVYSKMILPPYDMGAIYDDAIKATVSAAGVATISGLFKGATYQFWRGRSNKYRWKIPVDAEHPYVLPPLLGNDSTDPCIT